MTRSTSKVAILGAGGLTGQALAAALKEHRIEARALLRRAEYAGRLPEGMETAVADLEDVHALTEALGGCTAVYLIPPSFNEGEERFAANVMAAMAPNGIERLVYHSVLHAPTPGMPHHLRKSRVELMVRESDLIWTILQPAMYVQTVLSFLSEDGRTLRPPFRPGPPFQCHRPYRPHRRDHARPLRSRYGVRDVRACRQGAAYHTRDGNGALQGSRASDQRRGGGHGPAGRNTLEKARMDRAPAGRVPCNA